MLVDKLITFLYIKDITTWQGAILSSILIPFFFVIFTKIRDYYNKTRPIQILLKDFLSPDSEVLLFLSQLTAVDNLGVKNKTQNYMASYPSPLPTDKNNLKFNFYQRIDSVWSESDGHCIADIFNILGRGGKTKNIKIADTIKDWDKHGTPIFSIGFNPKTRDIINECNILNFNSYNGQKLSIDGHDLILDSTNPDDAGIIQKTFNKNTLAPVFILAGLGTTGTEMTGFFLSQNCINLGKLYGNKTFCVLLKTNITKGKSFYEIKAIYPNPSLWRKILYPITFFNWHKRKVFPKGK